VARTTRSLIRGGFAEVAAEAILLAGGGRALLLQLAHPAVAQGVAEHSDFERDPMRRLVGTLTYLYVLAFGTEEEIARIAREVGAAHRPVHRTDGPVPYDARDTGLQLWVAATLYDTTVQVSELVLGPLTQETADEVYRQSARIGTALGMPAADWPADRAAFREYWDQTVASLEVSPAARRVAWSVLHPRNVPLAVRLGMPLARLVTAGLLPESVAGGYRVRWTPGWRRRYVRAVAVLRAVYPRVPLALRRLPSRVVLERYRRSAAVPPTGPTPSDGT
jgi:uncharacterized protein (DUF2236 family)